MKNLILVRGGKFKVHATGPKHCGIEENLDVTYSMKCVCTIGSLDRRGFLFDQVTVDRYFQAIKSTKLSCEQLVIRCSENLRKHIIRENPGCKIQEMELTLSPAPFLASMTYHYKRS